MWLLDVGFDQRQEAKQAGARWDSTRRKWVFRGKHLPAELQPFAPARHSWERWLQDDTNGTRSEDVAGSISLRDHQEAAAAAIAAAASTPGFLLADDVGLGKTYSTIAGVNRLGTGLNVLVLSPLSVVPHWRRSIDLAGTGGNRWCCINYDRAKNLLDVPKSAADAKRTRTRNKRIAQQGTSLVDWDVVICDEAHKLKNPTSQRSAAVRNLIGNHSPAFTVYLSATAGQNPLELAYLSPLLAWRTGTVVRELNDFESWCASLGIQVKRGAFGAWEWDRNPRDLDVLRELLFGGRRPVGMRRRPQDLAGWPELVRALFAVELDQGERALYAEAWNEFRDAMALVQNGDDSSNPMVLALRFRQKASLLRVRHTAAAAKDLLDDGLQVAISVQFLETAEQLAEQLTSNTSTPVIISGRETASEREANRVAFQTGAANVAIFTVCEGISLHAGEEAVSATATARALLVHDLRWSALDMAQIEGRTHRDGQAAVAYYLYAVDTVEEKVANAVLTRLADMATLLGDETVGLDALLAEVTG